MADWKAFQVPLPISQLVDPVRQVLETLMVLLEILKTILETIKVFLVDFLNPIKALVEALIGLLVDLIKSLQATGCYAYFDVPDPLHDPNFSRVAGGFQAFIERFKGSLYDTKDFNRPQPTDLTTSGFVLLVVDAAEITTMVLGIKALLRLFGKSWRAPRYEAPANFKAIPVGTSGDQILAVASIFKSPITTIELKWDLPTIVESPDHGFSDAFTQVADEFIPPNFLIEKSVDVLPTSQKIDISALGNANSVGLVTVGVPQQVDQALASRFAKKDGTTVLSIQPLRDDQQEPFIKFPQYLKASAATDVTGAITGTFRFLDSDVQVGHVYYYRIRSFSGALNLDETAHQIGSLPTSYNSLNGGITNNSRTRYLKWPSTGDEVVMGKPSGIIRAVVPPDLGGFDVIASMRRLFLVAYSLDFHLPIPRENPDGSPPQFDASGAPVPPTPPSQVGKGSLVNSAGSLASLQNNILVDKLAALDAPGQAFNQGSLQQTTMPWQLLNTNRNANRLTDSVVAAMLQLGGVEAKTFQTFMTGSLPRGPCPSFPGATTLDAICIAFTTPNDAKENNEQTVNRLVASYDDGKLRQNVLVVVSFLKNFTLGGVPPDWIAVSPLRDIVPWATQLLYDVLAKIEALLDAFQGFLEEIRKFIDLLERKIDAMEKFIQFLIEILDFIQDLNFGVFVLSANNLSGDVSTWITTIDNAGGNKPTSGPGGYTAGIALAYALPNAGAIATALQTIFG